MANQIEEMIRSTHITIIDWLEIIPIKAIPQDMYPIA